MARDLDIKAIYVFCDSKLMSAQINTKFQAQEPRMTVYLELENDLISCFESFEITHITQAENSEADRLTRIGSGIDNDPKCLVETVKFLSLRILLGEQCQ